MSNANKSDAVKAIEELVKALNAGGYNVAPNVGPSYPLSANPLDLGESEWRLDDPKLPKKDDRYPHVCPKCKGPAYIGLNSVDCKNKC